VTRTKPTRT